MQKESSKEFGYYYYFISNLLIGRKIIWRRVGPKIKFKIWVFIGFKKFLGEIFLEIQEDLPYLEASFLN